jgi:hypothetical protein
MVTKSNSREWWKSAAISQNQQLEKTAELKTGLKRFSMANQNYRALCDLLPQTQRPPPVERLRDGKDIRCIAERTAWLECRIAKLKRIIIHQQKMNPTDVNLTEDPATTKRKQRAELVFRHTSAQVGLLVLLVEWNCPMLIEASRVVMYTTSSLPEM